MRILAFDSSGNACSAALWEEGRIAARALETRTVGQAERLVPMIERVLEASGHGLETLDLLAVTVGPGAFTGVRIGIATAQGLALGTGLPCLGFSSLEAVAHGVPDRLLRGRRLVVALDSRREELFLQSFDADRRPLDPPALLPIRDWAVPREPLLLAGDAAPRLAAALMGRDFTTADGLGVVDAGDLAELAAEHWRPGMRVEPLHPLYLHAPDVTLPKERGS